jgi:hypothetical protein
MQTPLDPSRDPRPELAPRCPGTDQAEFRFESEAALERAVALARGQSWVADCAVDRRERTLRVVLSSGTPASAARRSPAGGSPVSPTLH